MNAKIAIAAGAALMLCGCGLQPVQPWQREHLAKPEMAWEGPLLDAAQRAHTYASKEAATGTPGLAGGGCGCN